MTEPRSANLAALAVELADAVDEVWVEGDSSDITALREAQAKVRDAASSAVPDTGQVDGPPHHGLVAAFLAFGWTVRAETARYVRVGPPDVSGGSVIVPTDPDAPDYAELVKGAHAELAALRPVTSQADLTSIDELLDPYEPAANTADARARVDRVAHAHAAWEDHSYVPVRLGWLRALLRAPDTGQADDPLRLRWEVQQLQGVVQDQHRAIAAVRALCADAMKLPTSDDPRPADYRISPRAVLAALDSPGSPDTVQAREPDDPVQPRPWRVDGDGYIWADGAATGFYTQGRAVAEHIVKAVNAYPSGDTVQAPDVARRLAIAQVVAEHWRDVAMQWGDDQIPARVAAHPLACVLAAIAGETDDLGVGPGPDADRIRSLLGTDTTPEADRG